MSEKALENFDTLVAQLEDISDTDLDSLMGKIGAVMPWQGDPAGNAVPTARRDEDGFAASVGSGDFSYVGFQEMQNICWTKFNKNPFVFTTIMDQVGRLTGYGFSQGSTYTKAHEFMQKTWTDPRNMLVTNFSKYVARSLIQGELFMVQSIHKDGFVEVDFLSPSTIKGFKNGSGILTPENKPLFPLMYRVETVVGGITTERYIPSINLAYFPDLWKLVREHPEWNSELTKKVVGKDSNSKFRPIGGFTQFMNPFDQGLVTSRNVGRLKVTLEWLEHYDNIKKWELDHKKSSGAYLWTISVTDRAAFRLWLGMSDEDRKKTGLLQPKTPGMTVMLPPGFTLACNNPKLASITNQDDDILRMVSAGLNTSEDVMTGSSSGQTYGGVKMSRGPMADRITDQIAELDRYMIYGFWRGALWLYAKTGNMSWTVAEEKAYKFEKGEPKFRKVQTEAHETVAINWPKSEMGDFESKVKGLLGVKHGALNQTLGISNEDIAHLLGFQDYHNSRLKLATEEKMYPKLQTELEAEQAAEGVSEPGKKGQNIDNNKKDEQQPVGKSKVKPVDKPKPKDNTKTDGE